MIVGNQLQQPGSCPLLLVCTGTEQHHQWPVALAATAHTLHTAAMIVSAQNRVKEQRKKGFDEAQRKALADASAALQAATAAANGNSKGSAGDKKPSAAASADMLTAQGVAGTQAGSGSSSSTDKAAAAAGGSSGGSSKPGPGKAELAARVAYLQEAAKNYDDPGVRRFCVCMPGDVQQPCSTAAAQSTAAKHTSRVCHGSPLLCDGCLAETD